MPDKRGNRTNEVLGRNMSGQNDVESMKCFGTMVTTSQVEPRRNSDKCSSSAA